MFRCTQHDEDASKQDNEAVLNRDYQRRYRELPKEAINQHRRQYKKKLKQNV